MRYAVCLTCQKIRDKINFSVKAGIEFNKVKGCKEGDALAFFPFTTVLFSS